MMPFLPNQQEEQEQPQLVQPAQAQGQGQQQPGAASRVPGKSGSFTNLQKYLSANQGAAEQMGGKIGQRIQGEFNQTQMDTQAAIDARGGRGPVAMGHSDTQAALEGKDMGQIQTAVKQEYGRPGYTPGQQKLDGLLVQQTQGAQQQIAAPTQAAAAAPIDSKRPQFSQLAQTLKTQGRR
jgi:hypothetical protein